MEKRKVFLRADAGPDIGYGHFFRTLALADMLKDDFDCTFYTQNPSPFQKKETEKVCSLFVLPSDDSKYEKFLQLLSGIEIVVLDNYFFNSTYQKQIKEKGCKLVIIDDIHDRHFYADLIINHGNATQNQYDAEQTTRYCIGPSYALLRKPFLTSGHLHEKVVGKWVVCFGGVDPLDLTSKAVKSLAAREDVKHVTAIVGSDNRNIIDLCNEKITVLASLCAEEMAAQYSSAEYVLCSSSSVCYEALACGCSVFAGYYIDNQASFYEGLCKNELITPVGNLLEADFNVCLSKATASVKKLNITNAKQNILYAFKGLFLRIVNYFDISHDESRAVWEVRNLPEIRQCMTCSDPFTFESHQHFVETLRTDTTKMYFAIFEGNELVGSYDFSCIKDGDSAEHGLYVSPAFQRKGYGTVIESIMDSYVRARGVHRLLAVVLKSNSKSYCFHLKVGYQVYCDDQKFYYLEKYI